jgi:hypothetical protein
MMRAIISAAVAAFTCLMSAGAAHAADPTIAGAGAVVPGTQQFGNSSCRDTYEDGEVVDECPDWQYWTLTGTAGDRVTVNWQHSNPVADPVERLAVFPVGTDDFSINNVEAITAFYLGSNNRAQSIFTLPQTGTYPLRFEADCCGDVGGPYDFAVTVQHVARLFITSPRARAKVARNGRTVTVNVRNPDGAPLDGLTVRLSGSWNGRTRSLGAATSSGGVSRFTLNLPRGTRGRSVKLRAALSGAPGYVTSRSAPVSVRVRR